MFGNNSKATDISSILIAIDIGGNSQKAFFQIVEDKYWSPLRNLGSKAV
jgi:hypothetical protein